MHLCCAICADSITPSDDVQVTPCGHMFHITCLRQWLDRSSTCPQCRNRCVSSSLIRIYLNQSLNDTTLTDPMLLQDNNDNLKLQLHQAAQKYEKIEEELAKSRATQKQARKTILGLEQQMHTKELFLQNMAHDMDHLRSQNKRLPVLERKLKEAKETLSTLENVQNVVNSTQQEVEQMLKNEQSMTSLCTLIVTLKREQRSNETKRNDLRNTLKVSQMECNKANHAKRELLEKISNLESDLHKLQADVANNRVEHHKADEEQMQQPSLRTVSGAKKRAILPECTIAEETNGTRSPYLKIKSCSVGLGPLLKSNNSVRIRPYLSKQTSMPHNIGENEAEQGVQFSIFKKPRLTDNIPSALRSTSNMVYNGIGGTERREVSKFADTKLITSKR